MSKVSNVWVFSDTAAKLPEVIAGGLELGEKVSAFVIGDQADVAKAFACGATAVYALGAKDAGRIVEVYAPTMAQEIAGNGKPALVLMPATKRCKALAAKLGVALDAAIVNDATQVKVDSGVVKASHMVFGGLALSEECITTAVGIVTLSSGAFEAAAEDASRSGEVVNVAFVEPAVSIKCLERRAKGSASVDLSKARRVVGVGRGFAAQADIKMAEELCVAIGAELGCSRPIAEGEQWMERERYIGVSGVMLKPDVYLALGISGQIQHMVGVNNAQTIVAINKDKNAPVFQFADYGLVADIYKVLPALTAALRK